MDESATKRCSQCGDVKPLSQFYRDRTRPDGLCNRCKDCRKGADHQRYQDNRDAILARRRAHYEVHGDAVRNAQRRYRNGNREAAFSHYGRACACCGATENLTIDHINGDGSQHRRELYGDSQRGSTRFYIWLIKQGFPPGYQTLCHPCNASKKNSERCRLNHS